MRPCGVSSPAVASVGKSLSTAGRHGKTQGDAMSKTQMIADWLAFGCSPAEVAEKVACSPAYVRAVRNRLRNRERYGSQEYPAERRRLMERFATDPEFRARRRAHAARSYRKRKETPASA